MVKYGLNETRLLLLNEIRTNQNSYQKKSGTVSLVLVEMKSICNS